MKPIIQCESFVNGSCELKSLGWQQIQRGDGFHVETFPALLRHIAELSFFNPEYNLLFRGQNKDYRNSNGGTSLYPSLFRRNPDHKLPWKKVVDRYDDLKAAETSLAKIYELQGRKIIERFQIIRWAILQHYEICPTPLIDLTQSLRVACSFAQHGSEGLSEVFVYALGMPEIAGSITATSAHGIQLIRLLGICPPEALRAHHQEGYLASTFPIATIDVKRTFALKELDFSRRLLAKFRIPSGTSFWPAGYQPYPKETLLPDSQDKLYQTLARVRESIAGDQ